MHPSQPAAQRGAIGAGARLATVMAAVKATVKATVKARFTGTATARFTATLVAALLCTGAWAQPPVKERAPEVDTEKEAYAKLPPCKLSDDGTRLAEEPCRTAKALEPMPRRPVPQAIERVSPVENDPRDQVKPPSRVSPTPPTPPRVSPGPRPGAPVPTAGCDIGGCYGPNGQRYNNGPGNTVVSPSGKLCSRNGAWIQC